jgi:hypothetical protein
MAKDKKNGNGGSSPAQAEAIPPDQQETAEHEVPQEAPTDMPPVLDSTPLTDMVVVDPLPEVLTSMTDAQVFARVEAAMLRERALLDALAKVQMILSPAENELAVRLIAKAGGKSGVGVTIGGVQYRPKKNKGSTTYRLERVTPYASIDFSTDGQP